MQILKKLCLMNIPASFALLLLLPFATANKSTQNNIHKVSSEMTHDIELHGLLLWASMGFLMPVGILTIRMSNRQQTGRRLEVLFYFHAILQMLSVLLATVGAVLSIKNFENSFSNSHQRLGLALYGAIWIQALIGFCKPRSGSKRRTWYFVHWVLGTTICIVGILNIYTGLKAYHKRTSRSSSCWSILFTAQVIFMAFFYLFQDKWDYMQKQGVILGGTETITFTPTNQLLSPQRDTQKELFTDPFRKSNALGSYFSRSNALRKLFQLT
ncbi:cytochrome b561 domain-containing protein At4g18260 [Cornus florida]|uniref:cytochrome b561 domain-containing protein At4g18260 n=1 Tax=Cornus florida TaxID=4283 RepID=UPI00289A53E2|nr:cytochrome b561 domain-containing protein At4g18260 [Cornus florida]